MMRETGYLMFIQRWEISTLLHEVSGELSF